jgi:hypothetical protein
MSYHRLRKMELPMPVCRHRASSGFGAVTVCALADAGHTVYAGTRDVLVGSLTARAPEVASRAGTGTWSGRTDRL